MSCFLRRFAYLPICIAVASCVFPASAGTILAAQVENALPDTTVLSRLDSMLEEYLGAMEGESIGDKIKECDFLVSSLPDDTLRYVVSWKLFSHYRDSHLMGEEAVAVYINDAWFSSGGVTALPPESRTDASLFAEFNRHSLIGLEAPQMTMVTPDGESLPLPGDAASRKIIYFYDISCSKCAVETMLLGHYLEDIRTPAELFAVYVGRDRDAWTDYIGSHFVTDNPLVRVQHCWDPTGETDFTRLYSVVQTPRIFLVDPTGHIEGRRLGIESLMQLMALGEVTDLLDSRNPAGSVPSSVTVPSTVVDRRGHRTRNIDTGHLRGRNSCLVFYTEGCPRCSAFIAEADSLAGAGEGRFYLVDVTEIFRTDPAKGRALLDSFDLTALPHVLWLDPKGKVLRKGCSR